MRLTLLAAAVLGAAVAAPVCASAAQIIETAVPIPGAGMPTQVPWTYQFSVPTFNSTLGTLNSVEFLLSDSTSVAVQITNNNAVGVDFTNASAAIPLTITGPSSLDLTETVSSNLASGTADPGVNNYAPTTNTQDTSTSLTSGLSAYESSTPSLAWFLADAGIGTYSGNAGPNTDFGGTANVSGTFQVIYNYTSAVPEPGTWALMLLGVGFLGLALRRRKTGMALAAA